MDCLRQPRTRTKDGETRLAYFGGVGPNYTPEVDPRNMRLRKAFPSFQGWRTPWRRRWIAQRLVGHGSSHAFMTKEALGILIAIL